MKIRSIRKEGRKEAEERKREGKKVVSQGRKSRKEVKEDKEVKEGKKEGGYEIRREGA